MRVLIAPDSFKESMSAREAAEAIARGVRAVVPGAACTLAPVSDGGEGFTTSLGTALGATLHSVTVSDALGRPVSSEYAFASGAQPSTVVLEMASAAGLMHLQPGERDPMRASTRGVGELISSALDRLGGGGRLIIGIGGSATNDGGVGMLGALGARFLDSDGRPLPPVPASLAGRLARIDVSGLDPRLSEVSIEVACDVTNPLLGTSGASAIFGPQKGADPATVAKLEGFLGELVEAAEASAPSLGARAHAAKPGAGAAGGLGWALATFLDARFEPGFDLVARTVNLEQAIAHADLVLTGEGSIDAQTLSGKAPAGVAALAQRHGVPCVAFAGRIGEGAEVLYAHGVSALVPIVQGMTTLEEALNDGPRNLERAAATSMRLMELGKGAVHGDESG
ncbi:glycerate kinase [Dermabacter hominis]|uniref:glycerate kinase n=1 Tax=Dermabacter hominis TaxID=36740 RepID=UPI0021A7DEEA|nr:glycerate kinase [Dermabacter hominis]MCT2056224.1 glycerate kinase [Dermabacter hominis]MCT2083963.1 glycerate kinase [Dermabacter hominis]MCT2091716.1 glycerate kinase [Dermabacter hominis]MCT2190759.1 glycerate kinase [Dermabacter hominis]MCT2227267.1 glycerate kinase [Dermabacter hominis]